MRASVRDDDLYEQTYQCSVQMGVIDTLTGNLTYLVLLILLIAYIPLYFYVKTSPSMKEKGIVTYGPCIMLKTRRGVRLLDRIAKYKRFWAVFGTISKIMAFFLMAMILLILIMDLLLLPLMMETEGIGVEYALAIPGLNPMLPLVYGVIGLVVAVAVHEIAHGIQTRANDMKVESVGVLYAVVPIGAFVEPNEEEIQKCGRKGRSSMYAAGIAVNLTLALVLFLVMSFGFMGTMSSDFGDRAAVVNVTADSPAYDSGIGYSSVIWGVQANPSDPNTLIPLSHDQLLKFSFVPGDEYTIQYATKDNERNTALMRMGVFIEAVADNSPAKDANILAKSFLVSINGTSIDSMQRFSDVMASLSPGQSVIVEYAKYDGTGVHPTVPETVVLGERNGKAFLGVNYTFSGFSFTTPDHVLAVTKNPLHGAESVSDATTAALSYIGMPFRGYSPLPQEVQWWYHSSIMGDQAFWITLQTLFWIFWLNLVLAVTNALPAVPFDGGFLFMDGVGSIVDRTHKNATKERKEQIVNTVTRVTSYLMLFVLLLVMVAMMF